MDDSNEAPSFAPVGAVLVGKYRVERVLGRGGMGVVLLAEHVGLCEKVAIKMLNPEMVGADGMLVERFFREAQILAKIKNEHVVRVSDMGTLPEGVPFLVMEYLPGKDLSGILEEVGPFQSERAVDYVLQAMEAIAEAHSKGIVHRDIKPSNLFLTTRSDGAPLVKLLDFGISKLGVSEVDERRLTATQGMLGSPLYMSPEQLASPKNVGPSSDIWAIGVVLYELLTGQLPFQGETLPALTAKILRDTPPPPSKYRPELSKGLETVVLRCLQRSPSVRFSDMAHLAGALVPYATAQTGDESYRRIRSLLGERQGFADVVNSTGSNPAIDVNQLPELLPTAPAMAAIRDDRPSSPRIRASSDAITLDGTSKPEKSEPRVSAPPAPTASQPSPPPVAPSPARSGRPVLLGVAAVAVVALAGAAGVAFRGGSSSSTVASAPSVAAPLASAPQPRASVATAVTATTATTATSSASSPPSAAPAVSAASSASSSPERRVEPAASAKAPVAAAVQANPGGKTPGKGPPATPTKPEKNAIDEASKSRK